MKGFVEGVECKGSEVVKETKGRPLRLGKRRGEKKKDKDTASQVGHID